MTAAEAESVLKRVAALRDAAAALRKPIKALPERSRDLDYIDYPAGWAMQSSGGIIHTDERCSALQTSGAMLCDCDGLLNRWRELRALRDVAEILDHEAAVDEQYGATASTLAVTLAKRYLGIEVA